MFILTTCNLFVPYEPGTTRITNPFNTGSSAVSLTVYLDDNEPVAESRALSLLLAQMGYDFFEVVFKYGTTVARTSWELGQAAGVSGVRRGVNYGSVDPNQDPAQGGSAIMFLGNKLDKTLLAIGTISHVNGEAGAYIDSDSQAVTFTVSALTGTVNIDTYLSSFLTAARSSPYTDVSSANTVMTERTIGPHTFPWYILGTNLSDIRAQYTFDLYGNNNNFNSYTQAIILVGNDIDSGSIVIEKQVPRYTGIDGEVHTITSLEQDNFTIITPLNNTNPGSTFENPVRFRFDTSGGPLDETTKLFSFIFSVPVNALSSALGGDPPVTWYLRPGFGEYKSDLDTGTGATNTTHGSSNGGILVGTVADPSEVEPPVTGGYRLVVEKPATYLYDTAPDHWKIDTLTAELVGNGTNNPLTNNLANVLVTVSITYKDSNGNSQTFIIPATELGDYDLSAVGLTGLVTVTITYDLEADAENPRAPGTEGMPDDAFGRTYSTTFNILIGSTNILYRYVGDMDTELNEAFEPGNFGGSPPGTVMILMLLNPALDIGERNFTISLGDRKIIAILSTVPDAVLGRNGNAGRFIVSGDHGPGDITFYFGEWPFAGGVSTSVPLKTYPFRVNVGGSGAAIFANDTPATIAANNAATSSFITSQSSDFNYIGIESDENQVQFLNNDAATGGGATLLGPY